MVRPTDALDAGPEDAVVDAFAGISAFIALRTVRQSARLQQDQWRRDELELSRKFSGVFSLIATV